MMKTKNYFTLGIEIEGLYRFVCVDGGYGSQNGEPFGDYWKLTEDSSISGGNNGECYECGYHRDECTCDECYCDHCCNEEDTDGWDAIEIVSNVLNTNNYQVALKEFEKLVTTPNTKKLINSVEFNDSCGCHIHFQIPNQTMEDYMSISLVDKFRRVLKRKLDHKVKFNKISSGARSRILERYYRGYARDNTEDRGARGSINFSGEWNTIEWRSFNLTGVTTWKEFYEVFEVAVSTIDEMITNRHKVPEIVIGQ